MTVIIEQGTLRGQHFKTRLSNKLYVSFLGVPYAKPPIDDLRFKVSSFLDLQAIIMLKTVVPSSNILLCSENNKYELFIYLFF